MTPQFELIADDEDVTATIADRLIALTVTDEDGRSADKLRIEIDDRDNRVAMPEEDVALDLSLGFAGQPLVYIGRYAVDRVRGQGYPQKLIIDATAANMTGPIRAPRTRSWTDVSLRDLVSTIAGEHGLSPAVGASIADARWPFIAQTAESDLHLLTRLARTLDATAKPAGGALIVVKRGEDTNAEGAEMTPFGITKSALQSFSWDRMARENYATVEAEWGDIDGGETTTVTVGSGDPVRRLRNVFANAEEAQRSAASELAMADRARLKFEGEIFTFVGGLFAGGKIALSDMRDELNGDWLLRRVEHRLDTTLTTSFSAERAAIT